MAINFNDPLLTLPECRAAILAAEAAPVEVNALGAEPLHQINLFLAEVAVAGRLCHGESAL